MGKTGWSFGAIDLSCPDSACQPRAVGARGSLGSHSQMLQSVSPAANFPNGNRDRPVVVASVDAFWTVGAAPMNVSRFVSTLKEPHHAVLQVDLVPDISEAALSQLFDASQGGKKAVHNVLYQLVPRSMAECLLTRAAVAENIVLAELP